MTELTYFNYTRWYSPFLILFAISILLIIYINSSSQSIGIFWLAFRVTLLHLYLLFIVDFNSIRITNDTIIIYQPLRFWKRKQHFDQGTIKNLQMTCDTAAIWGSPLLTIYLKNGKKSGLDFAL